MSETQTSDKVSGADVISLVKESNDLFEQALQEVQAAKSKVASFEADAKDAEPLVADVVEKLANLRINGTPLIDEGEKQAFIEGMQSKKAVAEVLDQVVDSFAKHVENGFGQKVAASLGEPSDRPQVTEQAREGFAGLPGHRVQM